MNIDFPLSIYRFLESGNKKAIAFKLFNIEVSFLVFSNVFSINASIVGLPYVTSIETI